jgi:hypothetical protein
LPHSAWAIWICPIASSWHRSLLPTQRTSDGEVNQGNFNPWELRQELEYGVSDNYSVSLYFNTATESFRDYIQTPPTDRAYSDFQGLSIENRYMLLNHAGTIGFGRTRRSTSAQWSSYRQEKWWAALAVMPQVFGANFHGNPGGNSWLELEAHERVTIRLVIGISL